MKDPAKTKTENFARSCAVIVLIASLLLAGRNASSTNDKPLKPNVQTTKPQFPQMANA
jgi:hypothetical protein